LAISYVDSSIDQSSSATSVAPVKPTGLANGDVVLAWCWFGDATNGANADWSSSDGFTRLLQQGSGSGIDRTGALFRKVITDAAGEPSTFTFSHDQTADECSCIVIAFRDVDNSTPEDATTTQQFGANDSTPDSPAITTVTDGAMVVSMSGYTQTSISTVVQPSGFALAESFLGTDNSIALAYDIKDTAGDTGLLNWPNTGGGGGDEWGLMTAALRPAIGGIIPQVMHHRKMMGVS